jgi:hemerythrin-like domain-containing protein
MPHVDELRIIADYAQDIDAAGLQDRICREHVFLTQEFLPHMEIEQQGWYPAIELIVSKEGSVAPLRHAHDEVRALMERLGQACHETEGPLDANWVLAARRTLYQLYALLKVHLAEEELNAPLLERELSEAQATGLAAQLEFGEPPGH